MREVKEKKEKKEEIIWDKRKILVTLVILVLLIGIGLQVRSLFFQDSVKESPKKFSPKTQIKGISVGQASENLNKSFQESIKGIAEEAQNLNIAEVASTSPQVQKIINDLKSLKDLPKNQLKDTCERICGGL